MKTRIEKIDENNINMDIIHTAASIIKKGGLVAFPTETVYGLGADALREEASKKIYKAKGRPSDNPLIIHIAEKSKLSDIIDQIVPDAEILMKNFWPGPLTMIFKHNGKVPNTITGGLPTVAVRMPEHKAVLELIKASTGFIAAPSANISGKPSPTCAEHVIYDMDGRIDMILDGGTVGIGIESTIIDFSESIPVILRPGYISKQMIEDLIGPISMDKGLEQVDTNASPKAPGMRYRHYAPKAFMTVIGGEQGRVIDRINKLTIEEIKNGKIVGIIGTDESLLQYNNGIIKSIGSREDEDLIASRLYSILREFDDLNVDIIYSETFDTPRIGQAIMNRLLKAAGHHMIEV